MPQASKDRWRPLQEGPEVIGEIWPPWGTTERLSNLITALWSLTVPMRARVSVTPDSDRRPRRAPFPGLMPHVERFLPKFDARCVTVDTIPFRHIPSGLIILKGTIIADDNEWKQFFPYADSAIGRELTIVLTAVEFDRAAAEAYVVENLLPRNASRSGQVVEQSASPPEAPSPPAASAMRKPGRRPRVFEATVTRMRNDLKDGRTTQQTLANKTEKELESDYAVSRDTARRARIKVLNEHDG
jgi:hypothetical protein